MCEKSFSKASSIFVVPVKNSSSLSATLITSTYGKNSLIVSKYTFLSSQRLNLKLTSKQIRTPASFAFFNKR